MRDQVAKALNRDTKKLKKTSLRLFSNKQHSLNLFSIFETDKDLDYEKIQIEDTLRVFLNACQYDRVEILLIKSLYKIAIKQGCVSRLDLSVNYFQNGKFTFDIEDAQKYIFQIEYTKRLIIRHETIHTLLNVFNDTSLDNSFHLQELLPLKDFIRSFYQKNSNFITLERVNALLQSAHGASLFIIEKIIKSKVSDLRSAKIGQLLTSEMHEYLRCLKSSTKNNIEKVLCFIYKFPLNWSHVDFYVLVLCELCTYGELIEALGKHNEPSNTPFCWFINSDKIESSLSFFYSITEVERLVDEDISKFNRYVDYNKLFCLVKEYFTNELDNYMVDNSNVNRFVPKQVLDSYLTQSTDIVGLYKKSLEYTSSLPLNNRLINYDRLFEVYKDKLKQLLHTIIDIAVQSGDLVYCEELVNLIMTKKSLTLPRIVRFFRKNILTESKLEQLKWFGLFDDSDCFEMKIWIKDFMRNKKNKSQKILENFEYYLRIFWLEYGFMDVKKVDEFLIQKSSRTSDQESEWNLLFYLKYSNGVVFNDELVRDLLYLFGQEKKVEFSEIQSIETRTFQKSNFDKKTFVTIQGINKNALKNYLEQKTKPMRSLYIQPDNDSIKKSSVSIKSKSREEYRKVDMEAFLTQLKGVFFKFGKLSQTLMVKNKDKERNWNDLVMKYGFIELRELLKHFTYFNSFKFNDLKSLEEFTKIFDKDEFTRIEAVSLLNDQNTWLDVLKVKQFKGIHIKKLLDLIQNKFEIADKNLISSIFNRNESKITLSELRKLMKLNNIVTREQAQKLFTILNLNPDLVKLYKTERDMLLNSNKDEFSNKIAKFFKELGKTEGYVLADTLKNETNKLWYDDFTVPNEVRHPEIVDYETVINVLHSTGYMDSNTLSTMTEIKNAVSVTIIQDCLKTKGIMTMKEIESESKSIHSVNINDLLVYLRNSTAKFQVLEEKFDKYLTGRKGKKANLSTGEFEQIKGNIEMNTDEILRYLARGYIDENLANELIANIQDRNNLERNQSIQVISEVEFDNISFADSMENVSFNDFNPPVGDEIKASTPNDWKNLFKELDSSSVENKEIAINYSQDTNTDDLITKTYADKDMIIVKQKSNSKIETFEKNISPNVSQELLILPLILPFETSTALNKLETNNQIVSRRDYNLEDSHVETGTFQEVLYKTVFEVDELPIIIPNRFIVENQTYQLEMDEINVCEDIVHKQISVNKIDDSQVVESIVVTTTKSTLSNNTDPKKDKNLAKRRNSLEKNPKLPPKSLQTKRKSPTNTSNRSGKDAKITSTNTEADDISITHTFYDDILQVLKEKTVLNKNELEQLFKQKPFIGNKTDFFKHIEQNNNQLDLDGLNKALEKNLIPNKSRFNTLWKNSDVKKRVQIVKDAQNSQFKMFEFMLDSDQDKEFKNLVKTIKTTGLYKPEKEEATELTEPSSLSSSSDKNKISSLESTPKTISSIKKPKEENTSSTDDTLTSFLKRIRDKVTIKVDENSVSEQNKSNPSSVIIDREIKREKNEKTKKTKKTKKQLRKQSKKATQATAVPVIEVKQKDRDVKSKRNQRLKKIIKTKLKKPTIRKVRKIHALKAQRKVQRKKLAKKIKSLKKEAKITFTSTISDTLSTDFIHSSVLSVEKQSKRSKNTRQSKLTVISSAKKSRRALAVKQEWSKDFYSYYSPRYDPGFKKVMDKKIFRKLGALGTHATTRDVTHSVSDELVRLDFDSIIPIPEIRKHTNSKQIDEAKLKNVLNSPITISSDIVRRSNKQYKKSFDGFKAARNTDVKFTSVFNPGKYINLSSDALNSYNAWEDNILYDQSNEKQQNGEKTESEETENSHSQSYNIFDAAYLKDEFFATWKEYVKICKGEYSLNTDDRLLHLTPLWYEDALTTRSFAYEHLHQLFKPDVIVSKEEKYQNVPLFDKPKKKSLK